MAEPIVSDVLRAKLVLPLPPAPPSPKGGAPRAPNRAVLTGLLFVLRSGIRWEYLPAELGCGSGRACWRRLRDWQQAGVRRELHPVLLHDLGDRDAIHSSLAALDVSSVPANRGGASPGPTSTDRRQPGLTWPVVVDSRGLPLAVRLSAAYVHDSVLFDAVVYALETVCRQWSRPGWRPVKLHVHWRYDYPQYRRAQRCRDTRPWIACWGSESSDKVGRYNWVAERSLAWLNCCRRLAVRHEGRANSQEAFLHLGCTLICLSARQPRV